MRNLKKVIALVAVFAMMVSTVAFGQSFTDVAEDADYYEAIEMLSKLQILTGDDQDGDGKMDFRPNDTITRAEVAAIISRIQGVNSVSQTATEFVDVPATHWASGYIAAAAGQGIVNGYGDGNFGPDDQVLYEQAVKMLVETLGYTPYVETVGGYPVGHLTAASRYGVLDGVIGGTTGAEATRGQVAQMVFNAVDTPLMDRWTYGSDSEFLIYDGKTLLGSPYRSLLTDRLNVKKFEGVVKANRLTTLASAESDIDMEDEEIIDVAWEINDDYSNYDVKEIADGTLYAGESGISELIGKYVVGYAQEGNRTGEFTVLSAAAANKNKTLTINFDQFVKYYTANSIDYIDYYKNEGDRTATSVRVNFEDGENNTGILYNGAAVAASDIFASGKVEKDTKWSGMITLIDNDSNSGYDVAIVESGATAVVDEVTANGKISFKNNVKGMLGEKPNMIIDEDDATNVVVLKKDGVEIDASELSEWSVLSIYSNVNAFYNVGEVLSSSVIDGSVTSKAASTTSATNYEYKIAGKTYDVAKNAYECDNLKPGDAGLFYIDAYGKLVAYDKDGNKQASDNYGFVLTAQPAPDIWGDENLVVQILDKDGSVYNKYLAEKVKFENAVSVANDTVKIKDLSSSALDDLADELTNKLITYDCLSDGDIDEITFAQSTDEEDSTLYLAAYGTSDYRADDKEMKVTGGKSATISVDENTVVFFIKGDSARDADYGLGCDVSMSKTSSKVGTIASLADELAKPVAVFDVDNNDCASAIVIFNTSGGIAGSSNIAVISSVGTATNDEGEDVLGVEFYMNGEEQYALTDEDVVVTSTTNLEDATTGSIWKFAVANGVITEAIEYAYYTGSTAGATKSALTIRDESIDADKEAIKFGPVAKVSGNRIRIVDLVANSSAAITDDLTTINADGANVYVYDPAKRNNKISVGDASDANYDEELIARSEVVRNAEGNVISDNSYTKVVKTQDKNGTPIVAAGYDAWGMLDYAMGIEYENDVLDVVIYRAYDFGKYTVVEAE